MASPAIGAAALVAVCAAGLVGVAAATGALVPPPVAAGGGLSGAGAGAGGVGVNGGPFIVRVHRCWRNSVSSSW